MKRIIIALTIVISVLIFPISTQAQSSSMYSWTDKDGVKHYSDMAPTAEESQDAEVLESRTISTDHVNTYIDPEDDSAADALNNESIEDQAGSAEEELSYADQKRAEMQANREASEEKRAERDRMCLQARDEVAQLEPSRRVFYTNEAGETERMDDNERVKTIDDAKRRITEYCN